MISGRLRFESTRPTEFIDLTDQIRQEVKRAGLSTGRVHLQSLHTTLGLAVNENEPLLLSDFASMLQRIAPEPVAAPMRRLMEAGGKRIRPRLVQLTAKMGERYEPLKAAELAAAVEILHNATLVHDDYVDESTHRRGRPTVAAAEGAERAI